MHDPCSTAWNGDNIEAGYRHEYRAADASGQLSAHVFSAMGRTGWIVADGCDLVAGGQIEGGNPTAWKTARQAADAAMKVWQESIDSLRVALAPIEIEDDPTDSEIADLQADIVRGWAEKYGAETIEARLGTLRPRHESNPPADPNDLTDEQITDAAMFAAWEDTLGDAGDPLQRACFAGIRRRADQ